MPSSVSRPVCSTGSYRLISLRDESFHCEGNIIAPVQPFIDRNLCLDQACAARMPNGQCHHAGSYCGRPVHLGASQALGSDMSSLFYGCNEGSPEFLGFACIQPTAWMWPNGHGRFMKHAIRYEPKSWLGNSNSRSTATNSPLPCRWLGFLGLKNARQIPKKKCKTGFLLLPENVLSYLKSVCAAFPRQHISDIDELSVHVGAVAGTRPQNGHDRFVRDLCSERILASLSSQPDHQRSAVPDVRARIHRRLNSRCSPVFSLLLHCSW